MPSTKKSKKVSTETPERDSTYFLKLVLFVILGTLWIKLSTAIVIGPFVVSGIPLGLFVGLIFASHEHFQVDRKLEYAVLLLMTVVSYFLPAGIVI